MTFDEWVDKYNSKAPTPFKRDERYMLYYLPDKGFCEVGQTEKMVIIHQLCGDARYWKDKVSEMARKIGAEKCGTWCVRQQVKALTSHLICCVCSWSMTAQGCIDNRIINSLLYQWMLWFTKPPITHIGHS